MLGSAVLHIFYYGALQAGYRHGDLSVVYPLARGTGPRAVGHRGDPLPGRAAVRARARRRRADRARACSRWPSARAPGSAGACSPARSSPPTRCGTRTRWTRSTSRRRSTSGARASGMALLLLPLARGARRAWETQQPAVLGVGALSPLAYVLVLFALTRAPVSLVAPVRESLRGGRRAARRARARGGPPGRAGSPRRPRSRWASPRSRSRATSAPAATTSRRPFNQVPRGQEGTACPTRSVVLDEDDIRRTLVRIAHEIVEKNAGRPVALVGIHRRGAHLAQRVHRLVCDLLERTSRSATSTSPSTATTCRCAPPTRPSTPRT